MLKKMLWERDDGTSHMLPVLQVVDAISSAFCSRGSLALARSQTYQSSVLSVLLQLPNASINVGSCLSCCCTIMKPFVWWMPECFKKKKQASHELPKVVGQLVAVKWEAVQIPEHRVSLVFCRCKL